MLQRSLDRCEFLFLSVPGSSYSLHCSSFLGLPFTFLNIELVKPKEGTTMETVGNYTMKQEPGTLF